MNHITSSRSLVASSDEMEKMKICALLIKKTFGGNKLQPRFGCSWQTAGQISFGGTRRGSEDHLDRHLYASWSPRHVIEGTHPSQRQGCAALRNRKTTGNTIILQSAP